MTILIKRNQSENTTYCMIPTIMTPRKGKNRETIKRSVAARERRKGEERSQRRRGGEGKEEEGYIHRTQPIVKAVKLPCIILWCKP